MLDLDENFESCNILTSTECDVKIKSGITDLCWISNDNVLLATDNGTFLKTFSLIHLLYTGENLLVCEYK